MWWELPLVISHGYWCHVLWLASVIMTSKSIQKCPELTAILGSYILHVIRQLFTSSGLEKHKGKIACSLRRGISVRGRLHVLAVSLSRGRGPWHPSDRGLFGPQSLSEQRYLQQSTTVCSAHIRLRKYELKEGMLAVSYQLMMPLALDFHFLTACRTNSGTWEIEGAGVLMIDCCAMTACKDVRSDGSGKVLPASLGWRV